MTRLFPFAKGYPHLHTSSFKPLSDFSITGANSVGRISPENCFLRILWSTYLTTVSIPLPYPNQYNIFHTFLIPHIFEKACPDSCASLSAFHPMNLFLFLIIPAKTDCYNRFYIPSKWSWLFNQKQRMCLGTFSRLRRSLATSTLYVAVAPPRKVFYFTGRNFL